MTERIEIKVDERSAHGLAEAIRNAPGNVSRIEIGEGAERVILAGPAARRCGECTLCCTVAGVTELHKPPMVPCRHLKGHGCGIYKDRPSACSKFVCGWLLNDHWDERFRPDRVGAYIAFFLTEELGFYAVVQIDSRRLNKKRLRQLIRRLNYLPEIRVIYDDRHGVLLRHDRPPARFKMMPRPPGDYETAHYLIEGDYP